jgi:hypothetical protein
LANIPFLNDLAELGARTALAPRGLIMKREVATNKVSVVGRFGSLYDVSDSSVMPKFIADNVDFISVPDIRADARFSGHPMLDYVPRINSLIIANISPDLNYTPRYRFSLYICNSPPEAFEKSEVLTAITHVVSVCRQCVSALNN